MRTTLLAAIALLAFGASEGAASVADTSRAVPGPGSAPVEQAAFGLSPRAEIQLAGSARYDERQDGYGRFGVRVWMDGERDLYRVGDRSRVFVRTDRDAYVAVLHIDTNGDVEVLFPTSLSDDGYLRGGRSYSVRSRGTDYVAMRGGQGIGYVFAVASDEPLDFGVLRDLWYRRAGSWDSEYNVYGDPFRAMDRFERMLVRDWGYADHESSYYSYHVGRRYTHPRYACYDSYGSWYSSRGVYYDSCDRVRVLLVQVPYYYDTRYYRGDRRVYYTSGRGYYDDDRYGRRTQPTHGYKERTDARGSSSAGSGYSRRPVPPLSRRGAGEVSSVTRDAEQERQEPRVARPERQRPTFERRSPEPSAGSDDRRRAEPRERRTETRERREAPPERRAEPRSAPQERREAPAARESGGGSESSPGRPSRVRPPSE